MKLNLAGDETELMILPHMGSDKIPSYKQSVQANVYHFYILGTIEGPEKYLDLVQTLKTCEEHDTILIYINSMGGSLYTTIQIINAIQKCCGTVITCLEGEACSAASVILLAGQKMIINPFGAVMVHKYSHGVEGKGSDVAAQVRFSESYYDEIAYSVYADLMTKSEIAQMLEGKDFWFSSSEVRTKLLKAGREVLGSESEAVNMTGVVTTDDDTVISAVETIPPKSKKEAKKAVPVNNT